MTPKRRRWIWAGRFLAALLLVGIGIWMAAAGLDKANAVGGAIGLLVAIAALVAPYLLPVAPSASTTTSVVEDSGSARATAGGEANTGVRKHVPGRTAQVNNSGGAIADGPGSIANTGVGD